MPSFFEKLKKGMEIEEPVGEGPEEVEKKPKVKKTKKIRELKIKTEPIEAEAEAKDKKEEKVETEKEKSWFEPEGQLAIDVYQTESELVVQSAIAGIKPENLDISIESDVVTIRGKREKLFDEEGNYFNQECYWGPFSREIILPVEVDPSRAKAAMREGILTIRIPKILRERKRKILIKGE